MAWTFTSENNFTWNDPDDPFDSAYSLDSSISASGEVVVPGGRTGLYTEEFGYTPEDFNAGIPAGEGRTMFSRSGFRVGFFNAPGEFTAGEDQAITTYDEVFEYNTGEVQQTFTGETLENLKAELGLTIFREKLDFSFALRGDIVGRLVTDYPDSTPDEDIEWTGASILWSVSEDLDTTTSGPFSTWELSFERDALDLDNEPTGTETLDLTVTVVAWGAV